MKSPSLERCSSPRPKQFQLSQKEGQTKGLTANYLEESLRTMYACVVLLLYFYRSQQLTQRCVSFVSQQTKISFGSGVLPLDLF